MMARWRGTWRLIRGAGWRSTATLLMLMLMARITEGIGLLLLVPLLEAIYGAGGQAGGSQSQLTDGLASTMAAIGMPQTLGAMLMLFIGLILCRALLLYVQQLKSVTYVNDIVDGLRIRLFTQLMRAEWRWLSAQRMSDHAAMLTGGAGRIASAVQQLLALLTQVASLLTYGVAALLLSWQISLIAVVGGVLVHIMMGKGRRQALALGRQSIVTHRSLQGDVQDGLSGARQAKILRGESQLIARFTGATLQMRADQLAHSRNVGKSQLGLQVGGAVLLAGLLYVGKNGLDLPLSILLTIVLVISRLIPSFSAAQQSYHVWLHAMPTIDEMEILLAESQQAAEPVEGADGPPLPFERSLELRDVGFRHGGRDTAIFAHANLTIDARTTTLLTGPSGAGKSTLADLIMGLLTPDSGAIFIDGSGLTDAMRRRWRASVAYVQQDSSLFPGSIRDNLMLGKPDAKDADMIAALKLAAADFVLSLPEGLETQVGDSGHRLSGGERQRLALARALLAKPALLILDEATSALDADNDALIHQALADLRGRVTLLVISHHPDRWRTVDQHVRIDEGRIMTTAGVQPA